MVFVDSDLSQFVSEIWRYQPIIIVLLAGGFIMLVLCLVDTHRHRKTTQKKRHGPKKH